MDTDDIVLTGFMGTGKTTVGKALTKMLDRDFFDTDKKVEEKTGKTVASIFADYGEDYFRRQEALIIEGLKDVPRGSLVIATGGGAVLRAGNRRILKERGKVFLLTASIDEILRRAGTSERPLLKSDDSECKVEKMLHDREDFYREMADYVINTDDKTPADIAFEIADILKA